MIYELGLIIFYRLEDWAEAMTISAVSIAPHNQSQSIVLNRAFMKMGDAIFKSIDTFSKDDALMCESAFAYAKKVGSAAAETHEERWALFVLTCIARENDPKLAKPKLPEGASEAAKLEFAIFALRTLKMKLGTFRDETSELLDSIFTRHAFHPVISSLVFDAMTLADDIGLPMGDVLNRFLEARREVFGQVGTLVLFKKVFFCFAEAEKPSKSHKIDSGFRDISGF